mmetsp:Transcript_16204/g.41335  ORF Transcript_16204/g.41335 Transcript_16204/m.41335 type:complete len:323 (-) Transcript_16204:11-979(-)
MRIGLILTGAAVAAPARKLLTTRATGDCTGASLDKLNAGDTCTSPWEKLRTALLPTQAAVGYAWVERQRQQHFSSKKDASKWFGKNSIPAVMAPGGRLYLTDNHHHMSAVEYTGDDDIWGLDITVSLVCDLRDVSSMDDFWAQMQQRKYVYLYAPGAAPFDPPAVITPGQLPVSWSPAEGGFADDVWRALAAFSSHQSDDDTRCYVKTCTPFQDFEWGYMFNQATGGSATDLWASAADLATFKSTLQAQPYPSTLSKVDLSVWEQLGETLSSKLCHEAGVPGFALPAGFPASSPQGYVPAGTKVPADPDCDPKTCASAMVVV